MHMFCFFKKVFGVCDTVVPQKQIKIDPYALWKQIKMLPVMIVNAKQDIVFKNALCKQLQLDQVVLNSCCILDKNKNKWLLDKIIENDRIVYIFIPQLSHAS